MEIFRDFVFDSAHRLNHLPPGHKCARMHGHTYRLRVHLDGPLDPVVGWVVDFAIVKKVVGEVLDPLDHHVLNEIEGLEQPTAEHIVLYLWRQLQPRLPELCRLTLWENPTNAVSYAGEPVATRPVAD
ncbi:MAG: 6-carboxytetrahydropterin synthase QueD [Phycisphaerales bacterium]